MTRFFAAPDSTSTNYKLEQIAGSWYGVYFRPGDSYGWELAFSGTPSDCEEFLARTQPCPYPLPARELAAACK